MQAVCFGGMGEELEKLKDCMKKKDIQAEAATYQVIDLFGSLSSIWCLILWIETLSLITIYVCVCGLTCWRKPDNSGGNHQPLTTLSHAYTRVLTRAAAISNECFTCPYPCLITGRSNRAAAVTSEYFFLGPERNLKEYM